MPRTAAPDASLADASAAVLLCDARAIVAAPGAWTNFSAALSTRGNCCEPLSPRAARWGGISALRVAVHRAPELDEAAEHACLLLNRSAPGGDYLAWEHRIGRRLAHVLAVFDRAIAAAETL